MYIVSHSNYPANGKRLSDRFDMVHIKTAPVRISLPVSSDTSIYAQAMLNSMKPVLKHINCTIKPIKSYGIGYKTPHGNYTAFLGSLMENVSSLKINEISLNDSRQKSDFAFYGTPLGSFSYNGLTPGPVLSSLSLGIHSQVGTSVVVLGDALDTIRDLSAEVKLYLVIIVHLTACCMSHAGRNFFSSYLNTIWHSVLNFLDQENYTVKSKTGRIIWLSFNIFVFVSVFGFILNLMSTDAFVASPPRRIEVIEDVFDPYFIDRKIRYYLPTNDFFFNYLRDSKRGTAMRRLYDHMNSTKDCSQIETCNFIEVQTGRADSTARFQKMLALLQEKSEKDDSALFVTTQLAEHCVIPAVCRFEPDWIKKLYTSPQAVVEDVMITLQRADLGSEIGRYLRYKFSSFFEFDRLWRYASDAIHLAVERFSQGKNLRYYSCMARRMDTDVQVPTRVKLHTYSALFTFSGNLILLALVILLSEFLTEIQAFAEALRKLHSFLQSLKVRLDD
ncbi:hypothetical protein HDE_09564 [Halotydeus destructor]|nr:hypothetical protein HDE_09564 [Halotydeus destructor]